MEVFTLVHSSVSSRCGCDVARRFSGAADDSLQMADFLEAVDRERVWREAVSRRWGSATTMKWTITRSKRYWIADYKSKILSTEEYRIGDF